MTVNDKLKLKLRLQKSLKQSYRLHMQQFLLGFDCTKEYKVDIDNMFSMQLQYTTEITMLKIS